MRKQPKDPRWLKPVATLHPATRLHSVRVERSDGTVFEYTGPVMFVVIYQRAAQAAGLPFRAWRIREDYPLLPA